MSVGICLGLGAAAARADEQDEIKARLDKAIKAHGGEEKLAKPKPSTAKVKGKFYGMGDGAEYTLELSNTLTQMRFELDFEIAGTKFKITQVVNGDKGWMKINDATMDLGKDEFEEAKEGFYVNKIMNLVPLKEKEYKLSPLGESKVGKKSAVGIKVSHKGHSDVNLLFDKETGLLIKTETTIKDFQAGGQEVAQETIMGEYKEFDGRKVATKVVINRDGKPYVDGETTDYKFHDKLDDNVFAKP